MGSEDVDVTRGKSQSGAGTGSEVGGGAEYGRWGKVRGGAVHVAEEHECGGVAH